ncbi:MAG: hypothetical protein ACTH2Q_13355 [Propionibacteriaceae bacterium]
MAAIVEPATGAGGFPAPGSAVPGAPPALRRPLTAADGVPLTGETAPARPAASGAPTGEPVAAGGADGTWRQAVLVGAGLVGTAAGLTLQQWWAARRSRSRSS